MEKARSEWSHGTSKCFTRTCIFRARRPFPLQLFGKNSTQNTANFRGGDCQQVKRGRAQSGLQFAIPIQEVRPCSVQVFSDGHRTACNRIELVGCRFKRRAKKFHPRLFERQITLSEIVRRATGNDIGPARRPVVAPRDYVIESQIFSVEVIAAILAAKPVTKEKIISGEGYSFTFMIVL